MNCQEYFFNNKDNLKNIIKIVFKNGLLGICMI